LKLSFEQIEQSVHGVAYCELIDETVVFHRFTKDLEAMYRKNEPQFNNKLLATAGVSLCFKTDSKNLFLKVNVNEGSSRTYFSHDIIVDGKRTGELCNFDVDDIKEQYIVQNYKLGEYEKRFELGDGEKEIKILFPALVASSVVSLEIDDGASFVPSEEKGTYLALGDSISQGYDALLPMNRYTNIIAEKLDLYEHNLAIGGEVFRPGLAENIKDINPDFITVAYGSNDWSSMSYEEVFENCSKFFERLTRNLPDKKIFVISPIWRKDIANESEFGPFSKVGEMLSEICSKHNNLKVVDGFDFVPHNGELFSDGYLHPNDDGFAYYASSFFEAYNKS